MAILDQINFPQDLKTLDFSQLEQLAKEIREIIIEVVSKNGGHLSSNLGAVDLTIALHLVFNTPEDKIIWDVGHQSYTHKILTGRKDKIYSIRKKNGLVGSNEEASANASKAKGIVPPTKPLESR